ncbi:hypothetical protein [Nitriliruptor alkaliphilus]|uniref:hypothetical protein n=1 Tax=Nitriliruptor alkaliphilus TaxID=427918 RepID=UPI000696FC5B|nr:hypothetical protein [Nitriliruptor alkaliphilus]
MPSPPLQRARPTAGRTSADKRRARDRSLLRDAIVVLIVAAGLAFTWSVREVPNEDHPAAVDLAERLDETFRAVRAGDLDVDDTPAAVAPGVTGARLERVTEGDRWVLTGEAGSDCYVLWWDTDGIRRVRVLSATLPCEPSTTAMSPSPATFDRTGRAVDEDAPTAAWNDVLPDPIRFRFWFIPAMLVGAALGLSALVRMSIALLTGDAPSATRR